MHTPLARFLGASLVVLAASAMRVLVERLRGVVHADSDVLALFMPSFAWWWSRPRWLGGWNPWLFGGLPANADPQVATPHPLGLAYALADPLVAATIDGVLTPALGGIGMITYLRAVGCGFAPALVGALAFALGGYFTGHATNPGLMRAALAVPFALAALERLDGARLVAGFGAAVGLVVLSGHPQSIAYALVLVLAYAACFGHRRSARRALALGAGLGLGVALGAVVLLPMDELVRLSSRALGDMAGHADPKLTAVAALGLLVPFPRGGAIGPLYGASYQGETGCGLIECSGYPGTLAWLVVVAGLPLVVRSGRGRFWLVAGLAGAVLATGVLGAGTSSLRAPVRFLLWWNVAVPALAGLALQETALRPARRATLTAAGVLAAALAVVWLVDPPTRRVVAGSAVVLALGTLVLLAARAQAGRRAALAASLVVAFAWLEMVAYMASLPFGVPEPAYRAATRGTAFLHEARGRQGGERVGPLSRHLIVPLLRFADWAPFSETLLLQGYNSLLPARIAGLLGTRPGAAMFEVGWVDDPTLAAPASHVLDLLRTAVVAIPAATRLPLGDALDAAAASPATGASSGEARFAALGATSDGAWRLFANRRARPLAWVVDRVRIVAPEDARALVRDDAARSFDPAREALVERAVPGVPDAGPEAPPDAGPAPASGVEVVSFGEDEIRLVADTGAPGLLVTSEIDYPGWTASVGGAPADVVTANAGFRAVAVPAGRHEVVLAYRPWRSRVGLVVSLASGLVLLALAFVPRALRRRGA